MGIYLAASSHLFIVFMRSHFSLISCNPVDHSPPGSSVHGILQARILEWVALPSSRGFSDLGFKPASHTSTCFGRRLLYY